jgi:hypothetical protein
MELRLVGPLEALERDRALTVGDGRGAGAQGMAPQQPPTRFGWSLTVARG